MRDRLVEGRPQRPPQDDFTWQWEARARRAAIIEIMIGAATVHVPLGPDAAMLLKRDLQAVMARS